MTNNDWGKSTSVCMQNLSAPRAVHWIKLTKNNFNVIKYNDILKALSCASKLTCSAFSVNSMKIC